MKRSTLAWGIVGAAAAIAALAWAFAPRAIEVETATAREGPFVATIDEDGRTRLRDRYVVSAPLSGRVARLLQHEGDRVAAGGVVAVIAPCCLRCSTRAHRANKTLRVESAEAQVQRAAARVAAARITLEQAQLQLARSEQLSRQGFVAASKLDLDRLAADGAQKDLEAVIEERHAAGHDLEQARAALIAVKQADAGGGRAFEVRAPSAGSVLRVLQPNENAVALGTPLLEIGDVERLEVVAELLTTDAVRAQPGTRVVIERWGGDGVLEGWVRLVEPGGFTKVSALGVEEQRVNVIIDIVSPRRAWQALGDGFRVGVRIVTTSASKALQVPVNAVFPRGDGAGLGVLRVEDGRARLVPVTVVARNGTSAWIGEGLKQGDTVVIYPPVQHERRCARAAPRTCEARRGRQRASVAAPRGRAGSIRLLAHEVRDGRGLHYLHSPAIRPRVDVSSTNRDQAGNPPRCTA
jgi:HlyD family secretion protein